MPEKYKWDVENIVYEVQDDEKEKRKGVFSYLAIWCLHIQKLFNSSFVKNHLCDIFILILLCNFQGQTITKISDISVATFHQQFLYYPSISTHHCEMKRSHAICIILFVKFCSPRNQSISCVFLTWVASPVQSCTSFSILSTDLHALVEKVVLF